MAVQILMLTLKSLRAWTALLLCGHGLGKHINSFAGPYIAYAHRFSTCPSDGTFVFTIKNTHFNPMKPFEKQTLRMNISTTSVFDDSFSVHGDLAIRSNNEWKQHAFVFDLPGGGCSMMREHAPSWFYYLSKFAPEVRDKKKPCKLPTGWFEYGNESVSWVFPHFKVMPYGQYRLTVFASKGSLEKKACVDVECSVVPKPF